MLNLNLSKQESILNIDIRKNMLDNLCLQKFPVLGNTKARVALVLDYSGSMRLHYRTGRIQALIERILPIAIKFDDDAQLDFWLFDDGFHRLPSINMNNFYGYINNEVIAKYPRMGSTKYAPVMEDVYNKYIIEQPQPIADYVIYITDGANSDKARTKEVITYLSNFPIFWQFVGIGSEKFDFLQKLDDLTGRTLDNADFFPINDLSSISDEELYNRLLTEFPSWIVQARQRNMIY